MYKPWIINIKDSDADDKTLMQQVFDSDTPIPQLGSFFTIGSRTDKAIYKVGEVWHNADSKTIDVYVKKSIPK